MGTRSRNLRNTAALAIALVLGLGAVALSQNRPRYSSSPQADRDLTVPEGTVISMRMDRTLNSRTSRVGDRFTGTVTVPVHVAGREVIPAGSLIQGRITEVTPAKRMSKSGTIAIDFEELILPSGFRARLVGSLTSDDPATQQRIDEEGQVSGAKRDRAVFVGGGGAIGAVLGGIAGGGKGAVLGGIAGAGVGVAGVLLSKGEEAEVPTGTPFGVQLRQPLIIGSDPGTGSDPQNLPADRSTDPPPATEGRDRAPDRRVRTDEAADSTPPAEVRDRAPARVDDRADSGAATDREEVTTDPGPPAPALPLSSPEMIRRAQTALKEQGYYEGEIDGQLTARTANALRTFQRERKLAETGKLDDATAKALGILGATGADDQRSARVGGREPGAVDRSAPARNPRPAERIPAPANDAVLANVLSAIASRAPDGRITVIINTQANSGGWSWFGDHVVNGDTLEVYARAVRPTGVTTQVLTRGRIELNVDQDVDYVKRVVVHSAGGVMNVLLRNSAGTARETVRETTPVRDTVPVRESTPRPQPRASATPAATAIQRKAEDLLAEYQRLVGIRLTGTGLEFESRTQRNEDDIELLFALDSFANATQLYARLIPSLRDQQGQHSAALALAREARQSDRLISTSSSRAAEALTPRWDSIRQDILTLMQSHSIKSSDLDP